MLEISNAPLIGARICIHCIALGMICMTILLYDFNKGLAQSEYWWSKFKTFRRFSSHEHKLQISCI